MIIFIICRFVFIWVNSSFFTDLSFGRLVTMLKGGLYFDTSAILYTNVLYIAMMLFPIHYKENRIYQQIAKGIFVVTNMVVIIMNLMDTVYFQYTNRRTTASIFSEFKNEGNLGSIIGTELLNHWYLVLLAIGLGYALYKLYRKPLPGRPVNYFLYYGVHIVTLAVLGYLCVGGMRGGLTKGIRPITISNANQYVDRPIETAIVLNTPFAIYRTFGKKPFTVPPYFTDREQMESYYSPVHIPSDTVGFEPKNVVIIILESFGAEYVGYLNRELGDGSYKGYTPFLDSLMAQGVTYKYSFANGRKSIDGMPSVLSGIPMFVEPFFLTPSSLNTVSSVAGELLNKGYHTSFFHGARNGSMGFEAYSRTSGHREYYGLNEYNNSADFDGYWGIWDEEFLQYYAETLSGFPQPFASATFTLSSHHPFRIPERYEGKFPKGTASIHQGIGYSDYALKRFFETASKQPWYDNTLFVITADHTNHSEFPEYQSESGLFAVPILFFEPNSNLKGFNEESIAQQIDIMPTVLGYLGYDKPYVSFGCDLFRTPAEDTFAVNYINGIYQYFKGDYLLQFDGTTTTAVYAFRTDRILRDNLINEFSMDIRMQMENELKSIIQQYMERMTSDELVLDKDVI